MKSRPFAALALLAGLMASTSLAARPVRFAEAMPAAQGAVVVPLGSRADLDARGSALDATTREAISRALEGARFDYKAKSTLVLRAIGPWSQIVVIGTGGDAPDAVSVQDIAGIAARETASVDGPVTLLAAGLPEPAQMAVGASLSAYRFDTYRAKPEKPRPAGFDAPLTIVAADPGAAWSRQGEALVGGVTFARDLVNEPSNIKYPEVFVERTRAAFKGVAGVTIEALDVPAMEKLGMGSILSVGKGSPRPPRMLIVHYKGADGAPVVLAGKGITFDSGGISLKPGNGMWEMRTDMAGAAAVVGAALSLARSRAPVNVVAIAALAENMPDGAATRPGDVVTAHNGKTIEIQNTDAEGRLVLADALAYAETRFRPAAIVDIATLTGAVGGAIGDDYTGLFSRHDALADQLAASGRATGELTWRLPLNPIYAETMKSDIADIKNVAEGGRPGASLGAHFIGEFAKPDTPWAHLDMAFQSWESKGKPTVPKGGATGYGVRLLDHFVRNYQPVPRGAATGGR